MSDGANLRTAPPSEWPLLLEARHIGEILGRSTRSAQRKMAKGLCGSVIELDGVRYLRREAFLAALESAKRERPVAKRKRFRPSRPAGGPV